MKAHDSRKLAIALDDVYAEAVKAALARAERVGYTKPFDIGLCIKVALRERGLQVTWERGKRPDPDTIQYSPDSPYRHFRLESVDSDI
jgi:hypothetical protein